MGPLMYISLVEGPLWMVCGVATSFTEYCRVRVITPAASLSPLWVGKGWLCVSSVVILACCLGMKAP